MNIIRSGMPGIQWPAFLQNADAQQLAMQFQFEQSQWWSPETLLAQQLAQLRSVLSHAAATVPYYREQFAAAAVLPDAIDSAEAFRRVPILTRAVIQEAGMALRSTAVPISHGALSELRTSGSTGQPIRTVGTEVTRFFWRAFTLREHLWQQRDLGAKLATIRTEGNELGPEGHSQQGWGVSTDGCYCTGPSAVLGLRHPVDVQAHWLQQQDPDYLLTHPTNLRALARYFKEQGLRLPRLRQVRSFGETLSEEVRQVCTEVWGVPVADVYSSQEVGYIALQCPRHAHYHVQGEGIYVEVLDAQDRPCAPGEIGRVVISTLHNFAAPLIRYALGDYAEVGAPCDCGRGLPVLTRILGRQRNMLTLPDGRQLWPSFPTKEWDEIAPIRHLQLVQQDVQTLEVRIVIDVPLREDQEARLSDFFKNRFGYPFTIVVTCLDAFERAPNSKFEEFISKVPMPSVSG